MKIVKGDLVKMARDGKFDVIVHGCNCRHVMGAGIAKQLALFFPEIVRADMMTDFGPEKLGTISWAAVRAKGGRGVIIINAYTQADWRGTGCKVDYDAIREAFRVVRSNFDGLQIAYPKIGAGLGGGDWAVISEIIEEELAGCDHTLVEYDREMGV